ncbi:MAG: hypothetical protein GDA51_04745 [Ekhidna sp.]|nr:hypothetical protein [Ekhidna sp.]
MISWRNRAYVWGVLTSSISWIAMGLKVRQRKRGKARTTDSAHRFQR